MYAFSIAANVLLSFFPFMVLVLSVAQNVFHWRDAADVLYVGLRDYLPEDPGLVDFVVRNLRAAVASRGRAEALSVAMLVFSSNGIFLPLEVALNRLWGFPKDRPYWANQLLSLFLALACGLLALAAALVASANVHAIRAVLGPIPVPDLVKLLALKLAALPLSILLFFLVYWLLPNGPIPLRRAARVAFYTGLAVEAAKYAYLLAWPLLGFRRVYGPFFISVTLLMWGYLAAMIVLAGAELSARGARGGAGGLASPQGQAQNARHGEL
jgi:YihY family inner membrane protein